MKANLAKYRHSDSNYWRGVTKHYPDRYASVTKMPQKMLKPVFAKIDAHTAASEMI